MQFDYIIVGAGSAGCVLANRLSKDHTVCLIEAGKKDNSIRIQLPAGTITLYKSPTYSWNYYSVPQKNLNNRPMHTPRGKMLGGSSSMNSMIYIRGTPEDYDTWAASGCPDWSWKDVLPVFKKLENNQLHQDPKYHGFSGELEVTSSRDPNEFDIPFIKAANMVDIPSNPDFNGETTEGVGIYNVTQKNARRLSSYRAFVAPILEERQKTLTLMTNTQVEEILFSGNKVAGVKVKTDQGTETLDVNKELILSAGSIESPHLLLKAGIGPKAELEAAGIPCRIDLPGVGKNLQEHIDGLVTVRTKNTNTLGFSVGSLRHVLPSPIRYWLQKKGWLTTNYVEAGGFAKLSPDSKVPDVQFHYVPGYRSHRGRLFEWGHGYAIHTCVLHPKSRGSVYLDKNQRLCIDYNFLDAPEDMEKLIKGVQLAQKILRQAPYQPFHGKEILPGDNVKTHADYEECMRESAATVYHPVGTCKMGQDDMAVVTPRLKVRGVDNLRVIDASIMPNVIGGNTNAPTMMIGQKGAEYILEDDA